VNLETAKRIAKQSFQSFQENDLLSYASAMAFQALFALIPAALAGVALLGYLNLEEVWQQDLAPQIEDRLEPDAYSVVERTVEEILGERRGLWLTFGIAFALWQVSGAVRATMTPLNGMYHDEEDRPFVKRFLVSFLLAPAIFVCIGTALISIHVGANVADRVDGFARWLLLLVRWPVAALALAVSLWLLLRFAPAKRHSTWTGIGALFVLVAWLATSFGFALYASYVADYGSVFGSLASAIVLLTYLYLSTGAFLLGAQLDAAVRAQSVGPEDEQDPDGRQEQDEQEQQEEDEDGGQEESQDGGPPERETSEPRGGVVR
jgi:membrane protein